MLTYFMLNFLTKKSLFLYIFLMCSHSSWLLPGTCVQNLVSLPANESVGMTKNTEEFLMVDIFLYHCPTQNHGLPTYPKTEIYFQGTAHKSWRQKPVTRTSQQHW